MDSFVIVPPTSFILIKLLLYSIIIIFVGGLIKIWNTIYYIRVNDVVNKYKLLPKLKFLEKMLPDSMKKVEIYDDYDGELVGIITRNLIKGIFLSVANEFKVYGKKKKEKL